ncbi:MAG: hypothetical protein EXR62_17945 [Chloroflexi bacterium]|nr:hypothetical protein [Chloroflexota bacterium]
MENNPRFEVRYFQPNQLVYLVRHPGADTLDENYIQDLIHWSNNQFPDIFSIKGVMVKYETGMPKYSFSTRGIPSNKQPVDTPGGRIRPKVRGPQDPFTIFAANVEGADQQVLARMAHLLDTKKTERIKEIPTLEAVSLNWLGNGSAEGPPTGGPGGPPEFYGVAMVEQPYFFNLPAGLVPRLSTNIDLRGKDVHVAILDSLFSDADKTRALTSWPGNPLVSELLSTANILEVYPYSAQTEARLRNDMIQNLPHKMSSHGLFSAGIIHAIAPSAKLHLIQILNEKCVGDLLSLVDGFSRLVELMLNNPTWKWVVNASFLLDFPIGYLELLGIPNLWPIELLLSLVGESEFISWFDLQGLISKLLGDFVYLRGSMVIAAAGNDGLPGQAARPGPHYPAAADSVLGVGAMAQNPSTPGNPINPAAYSNIADTPPFEGLTTLGGEVGAGILGIYIDDFPNGVQNPDGWCRWFGTSFSTAVASGMTAARLSELGPLATTEQAINDLFQEKAGNTPDSEVAIKVEQVVKSMRN